jgi:hypothetical protein
MRFNIEERRVITRPYVRENRHKIFIFGDNLLGKGFGGQAKAMRGEPNAIGIPTKKTPSMDNDAFFTDIEFETNKAAIGRAFRKLSELPYGTTIVIPTSGLGTGRAELQQRAPKTFAHLRKCFAELQDIPVLADVS